VNDAGAFPTYDAMKKTYLFLLVCVFFLWGCSDESSEEKPKLSPTTFPVGNVTQVSLTTQRPTNPPLPETTDTDAPADQVLMTATPGLIGNSNAGIEAKNVDDVRLIAQAGFSWTRFNSLEWQLVEPSKGARDWAAVEALESQLLDASALGLETILIVRGTPDWAQKVAGFSCGPVREDEIISMGDFLYAAVQRYSQPPYSVKYWELGNEPDVNVVGSRPNMQYGCWGDSSDVNFGGGYYAEMLKVVYPRIKSADPQAQVLVGGLLLDCDPVMPPEIPAGSGQIKDCKPATFLEGVLMHGGGEYFDGVAFHAYDYYSEVEGQYGNINWHSSWDTTGPVLTAKTNYLRSLLEEYGYKEKFLMNTEGALICGRDGKEPACSTEIYDITKASYIVHSFTISRALGLRANIWFNLHGWRGSGLLDEEGNPLDAYHTLRFHSSILSGANYQAEIKDYDGLIGFSFDKQDSIVWVLWSLDGTGKNINPDTPPDHIYDILGTEVTANVEILIGYSPIYLVWDK
jgi:hypothetical protein